MDVELKIVNATALDPGKIYLLEFDRRHIPHSTQQAIVQLLGRQGIKAIGVQTENGHAITVKETETP